MYTLGEITLPNPKKFTRNVIEQANEHLLMFGKTTKKVENRKEQFILEYQYLTQAQVNAIFSQQELNTVVSFQIDEGSFQIGPTDVLIDISGLEFPQTGKEYRQNMILTLTEVK